MIQVSDNINSEIHVGGRKNLRIGSIVNFIANENYTQIFMADGTKYIVATTLKQLEAKTSEFENFVRPNRSVIVNTDFASLEGSTYVLPNKKRVGFSRRRWRKFSLKKSKNNAKT